MRFTTRSDGVEAPSFPSVRSVALLGCLPSLVLFGCARSEQHPHRDPVSGLSTITVARIIFLPDADRNGRGHSGASLTFTNDTAITSVCTALAEGRRVFPNHPARKWGGILEIAMKDGTRLSMRTQHTYDGEFLCYVPVGVLKPYHTLDCPRLAPLLDTQETDGGDPRVAELPPTRMNKSFEQPDRHVPK